jgi:hypothetical protein
LRFHGENGLRDSLFGRANPAGEAQFRRSMRRLIPIAAVASALAWKPANAADAPVASQNSTQPEPCFASLYDYLTASAEDCPLTWNGVTFYGRIDVGVTHDTHGVPFNGAYPNGVETLISKNSNRSLTSIAPNGLGQSFLD